MLAAAYLPSSESAAMPGMAFTSTGRSRRTGQVAAKCCAIRAPSDTPTRLARSTPATGRLATWQAAASGVQRESPDGAHADPAPVVAALRRNPLGGPETIAGTSVTIHLHVDDADAVIRRAVEAGATLERAPRELAARVFTVGHSTREGGRDEGPLCERRSKAGWPPAASHPPRGAARRLLALLGRRHNAAGVSRSPGPPPCLRPAGSNPRTGPFRPPSRRAACGRSPRAPCSRGRRARRSRGRPGLPARPMRGRAAG